MCPLGAQNFLKVLHFLPLLISPKSYEVKCYFRWGNRHERFSNLPTICRKRVRIPAISWSEPMLYLLAFPHRFTSFLFEKWAGMLSYCFYSSEGRKQVSIYHGPASAPPLLFPYPMHDPLWGIITVLFLTEWQFIQPPDCLCITIISTTAFLRMQWNQARELSVSTC